MGDADNFCLRWNDFESNISASFRDLRQNSEFFDVTLCCDNGIDTVQAHRVILASCSPLLRRILSHNSDKNPFIYLKGIGLKELEQVLNFMYYGEVNISQDSLNKFLIVAEELAVKGLTSSDSPLDDRLSGDFENSDDTLRRKSSKKSKRSHESYSHLSKRKSDHSVEIDLKRVKTDPEDDEFFDGGDDFESGQQLEDDFDEAGLDASQPGTSSGEGKTVAVEEARFTQSVRGFPHLIDQDDFRYVMSKKKAKRIYWVCSCKKSKVGCKATAVTEGFAIVKKSTFHNHKPN